MVIEFYLWAKWNWVHNKFQQQTSCPQRQCDSVLLHSVGTACPIYSIHSRISFGRMRWTDESERENIDTKRKCVIRSFHILLCNLHRKFNPCLIRSRRVGANVRTACEDEYRNLMLFVHLLLLDKSNAYRLHFVTSIPDHKSCLCTCCVEPCAAQQPALWNNNNGKGDRPASASTYIETENNNNDSAGNCWIRIKRYER